MAHGDEVTARLRSRDLFVVCPVAGKLPLEALDVGDRVPPEIDGIPADVVDSGVLYVLATRTERSRPAPGGVSIGHRDILGLPL